MPSKILVINGPNSGDLNDADGVEDSVPGLEDIRRACEKHCNDSNIELDFRQSDDPRVLIEWLQKDSDNFDGLIFNPVVHSAGDSDISELYESAMRIIAQSGKPAIEVRLNNIYKPDENNSKQAHKPGCNMGFVCGFGLHGYLLAINAMAQRVAT